MSSQFRLLSLALLILVGTSVYAAQDTRGFIPGGATTPDQLVKFFLASKSIRSSYTRYFQAPDHAVRTRLSALHAQPLDAERDFVVTRLDGRGDFKGLEFHMHKGELVFADASGNPVLRAADGGPLSLAEPVLPVPTIPLERTQNSGTEGAEDMALPSSGSVRWLPFAGIPILAGSLQGVSRGNGGSGGGGGEGVPEPASCLSIAAGIGAMLTRRKRRG